MRKMRGGDDTHVQEYGGDGEITTPSAMLGGSSTLAGVPITGGVTSGQQYGANAAIQRGGNLGRVIVPAALVLANNVIGRGRSMRYKGKGAFRGKSSRYSRARYSRRRRGSRRR